MATQAPSKGSRVWVQRPSEGWRRGTVAGTDGGGGLRVVLDCEQLGEGAGPEVAVPPAAVEPANPVMLDGVRRVRCRGCSTAAAAARDHPASPAAVCHPPRLCIA